MKNHNTLTFKIQWNVNGRGSALLQRDIDRILLHLSFRGCSVIAHGVLGLDLSTRNTPSFKGRLKREARNQPGGGSPVWLSDPSPSTPHFLYASHCNQGPPQPYSTAGPALLVPSVWVLLAKVWAWLTSSPHTAFLSQNPLLNHIPKISTPHPFTA